MEKILEIVKSVRNDVDFENEKHLIDDEILDSFDVVEIADELMDEFDIEISVIDIQPENFNSIELIYDMVQRKIKKENQ